MLGTFTMLANECCADERSWSKIGADPPWQPSKLQFAVKIGWTSRDSVTCVGPPPPPVPPPEGATIVRPLPQPPATTNAASRPTAGQSKLLRLLRIPSLSG